MTDISVSKRKGYTVIPNDLLEPNIISAKAWGLYCYLISRPDGWRCNVKDLMNWFTEGRDAILDGLKQLVVAGYMDQVSVREGNLIRRRFVIDADRRHRHTDVTSVGVPTGEGVPRTDFQGPESQGPEMAAHKNKELRSTEVRKPKSTNVLFGSDRRRPASRSDASRPGSKISAKRRRDPGSDDAIDPAKAVADAPPDPEPRRRSDSSLSLVAYFYDRLKASDTGARAIMTIPDPVNKRQLSIAFTRWKRDGITPDRIRAMIDAYAPDDGALRLRIPPWKDFLAQRARLSTTVVNDKIINDPTSQEFLDYWGLTAADMAPLTSEYELVDQ